MTVKNSSEIRSIEDMSSLSIHDNSIVASLTNSGGYDLTNTGQHNYSAMYQIVNEEPSSINSNVAIASTGDVMLER